MPGRTTTPEATENEEIAQQKVQEAQENALDKLMQLLNGNSNEASVDDIIRAIRQLQRIATSLQGNSVLTSKLQLAISTAREIVDGPSEPGAPASLILDLDLSKKTDEDILVEKIAEVATEATLNMAVNGLAFNFENLAEGLANALGASLGIAPKNILDENFIFQDIEWVAGGVAKFLDGIDNIGGARAAMKQFAGNIIELDNELKKGHGIGVERERELTNAKRLCEELKQVNETGHPPANEQQQSGGEVTVVQGILAAMEQNGNEEFMEQQQENSTDVDPRKLGAITATPTPGVPGGRGAGVSVG